MTLFFYNVALLAALVAGPAMGRGRRFGGRGRGRRGAGGSFGRFGRGRLFVSRLFGGFFLRRGVSYRGFIVFDIACQVSLTPRPVKAENGNGSTPSSRMARKPRSCSDRFNLSVVVAITRYCLP